MTGMSGTAYLLPCLYALLASCHGACLTLGCVHAAMSGCRLCLPSPSAAHAVYAGVEIARFRKRPPTLSCTADLNIQGLGLQVAIQEGMFFAAVYNPPTRLFGRRNEVWFLPSEEDAAAAGFLWASEGTAAISSVQLEQLTTAAAQAA